MALLIAIGSALFGNTARGEVFTGYGAITSNTILDPADNSGIFDPDGGQFITES